MAESAAAKSRDEATKAAKEARIRQIEAEMAMRAALNSCAEAELAAKQPMDL
jgi:hypothetical protein